MQGAANGTRDTATPLAISSLCNVLRVGAVVAIGPRSATVSRVAPGIAAVSLDLWTHSKCIAVESIAWTQPARVYVKS